MRYKALALKRSRLAIILKDDFVILNQESTALTKTVGVSETYGHVGREFKLRPFSGRFQS
jgi:hypothetical protein